MIGNPMVSHMSDFNIFIHMCRCIPLGLWWIPWDVRRHHCYLFSSQVVMDYSWVLWRLLRHHVVSLMYVHCDIEPRCISLWIRSLMLTWIHNVSYCGHDHVYHTWICMYYFSGHALFLLLSMGIPTSGMLYIWLTLGCLQVLTSLFLGSFLPLHYCSIR